MNTRKCKKCGWEVPATQPGLRCPICKEIYDEVVCYRCGKIVSGKEKVKSKKYPMCRTCHNELEREHSAKYLMKKAAMFDEKFENWLEKISRVPKNYKTLSEEQWLEACRYFEGCARCGKKDIDNRGFFISFENGGRYCDWNIIPLCDTCASKWNTNANPFSLTLAKDRVGKTPGLHQNYLDKIVEYLDKRLDAAIGENSDE